MAPPKDIARSYPKRGLTADVGFRSEPKFCGDGAATFPTTSDYAQTAASADLALGDTYTVCAWVRHATSSSSTAMSILSSGSAEMTLSVFAGSNPALYVFNGSANMNTTGVFTIDLHTWYHVAIVIKSGGGNSQIFINGIDRTASHSLTFPASGTPSINLGGYLTGGWQGDLANVALFTSSLTEDQVRQAMRASDYASHAAIATLEAFYPLSADFNDSTGSHNATASGSPEFRPNRPQLPRGLDLARGAAQARVYTGRAVDFDGSADYLDVGRKDFGTGDFSISLWFYDQVSSGGNRSLYSKGTYNTVGGLLIYNVYGATGPGEYLMLRNDHQASGGLYDDRLIITTEPTPNAWHHIAVTRTGGTVKGYFDGKLVNTSTNFNPAWDINVTQNSFIGARDPSSPGSFWDGFISSVKVWDTVLTDAQVAEQFHNPEQVLPTGTSASNLDRYYPLSDYNDTGGTGGRWFQDMGADGAPAEDQGSASMAFAQPVPCPQLGLQQSATRAYFPGTTVTGSATIPALGGSVTIACWFFWDDSSRVSYPLSIGVANNATNGFNIRINTSGEVTTYAGAEYGGNLTVNEGSWNHIVLKATAGSPYWALWVNGTYSFSRDTRASAVNITSTSAYVGTNDNNFGAAGIVADAAIWNSELGNDDVAALYNSGVMGADVSQVDSSNLVAWWKCDGLTTFKDYSGNGRTMSYSTVLTAASFPENASGSTIVGDFSMKRKGVSVLNPTATPAGSTVQSAIISNNGSLSPDPSKGGYSFSAFIRFEQTSGASPWFPMVFSGTNYLTASQKFFLNFGNFSVASAAPNLSISDGSTQRNYSWPSVLSSPEEWHQLAFTIDYTTSPNTTFKFYLDGALVSTQAAYVHSAFDPGDIIVGSYTAGNGNFPGAIACFKMYQTKLSDNEMEQVYRSDLRLIKGLENE